MFRLLTIFVKSSILSEAAVSMCFYEKVFWNYAALLQENIHAKVRFQ